MDVCGQCLVFGIVLSQLLSYRLTTVIDARHLGSLGVVVIGRNGDGCQDADDGNKANNQHHKQYDAAGAALGTEIAQLALSFAMQCFCFADLALAMAVVEGVGE